MKIFVSVCIVLFVFLNVHKSEGQDLGLSTPKTVNIIVILDTSNRVSKNIHPGQVERDKEIVHSIVDLFDQLVSSHFATLKMGDPIEHPHRLTFVVPEQPGMPPIQQDIMRKLTIESQRGGKDAFIKQKKMLLEGIDELYTVVENQNKFPGSDIWKWFNDYAEYYLPSDAHNCIICLSDGYLNFDRNIETSLRQGRYMQVRQLRGIQNWEREFQGLSPINKNFSAEFLMIEIALQRRNNKTEYTEDFDIIKKYWKTWFNSMGIMEIKFIKKGINTDILKTTIESFILDK